MNPVNIDSLLDTLVSSRNASESSIELNTNSCYNCQSTNISFDTNETVCCDCGVIQNSKILVDGGFNENTPIPINKKKSYNNKLQKMLLWYMWSNEEKTSYKLSTYTKELCNKLEIPEAMHDSIVSFVKSVMTAVKKYEGTKRARVKDGIIIVCIQYVSKNTCFQVSSNELAKRLNLDSKYITKAEMLILELLNKNMLQLQKETVLNVKTPFEYVSEVIQQHNITIPEILLKQTQTLINICEQKDFLLDHTPLSIGVATFYYILKVNNVSCDLKMFCQMYDLSVVTVLKTYNKLAQHKQEIDLLLGS